MMMRKFKAIVPVLVITLLVTGCTNPFAKKKPVKPVYGKDPAYTKKVDDYIAAADVTVDTSFGRVALMDVPDTTEQFSPDHKNGNGYLKEAMYLRDMTDNERNTRGKNITHFSYIDTAITADDIQQMCTAFVLQSADVPQSIYMDKKNALCRCYKALPGAENGTPTGSGITAGYPDGTKEYVSVYKIVENAGAVSKKGKGHVFSYVYVIPYNGGTVFMETYPVIQRNAVSAFEKSADKAKELIGSSDEEIAGYIRKYVEKNRKKLLTPDDKASVEECRKASEALISGMYLARHDTEEQIAKRQEKAVNATDIVKTIPVYKPETTLAKPQYEEFGKKLDTLGYNEKEQKKKEKKDLILYYYDYPSRDDKRNSAHYELNCRNGNAGKRYKKLVKENSKKGYEVIKVTGKNFEAAYGYDRRKNSMWALYYFPQDSGQDRYKHFYKKTYGSSEVKKIPRTDDTRLPRIVSFKGTMPGVINLMKTIEYEAASYETD